MVIISNSGIVVEMSESEDIDNEPLYERFEEEGGPDEEELADFKAQVEEWVKIDDQVRKLNVAIRERRTQQRALSSAIQTFMLAHKYDSLSTEKGAQIKSNVRKVKAPVRVVDVRQKLIDLKGDTEGGELIRKIWDEDRAVIEKKSLRRVIPKVHMHLDL